MKQETTILDRFEQALLFRLSRNAQILVSAVLLTILIIGVLAFGLSFLPVSHEPSPPDVTSDPVRVSSADVTAYLLAQRPRSAPPAPPTQEPADSSASSLPVDPNAVALATLVDSLRRKLTARGLVWSQNAGPFVINVLTEYNRGGLVVESQAPSGDTYLINVSSFEAKQTILNELLAIAESSAQGQEMASLTAWHSLRRERERASSAAIAAAERSRQQQLLAIAARYESRRQTRLSRRTAVIRYAPWAVGALVLAGLSLSLLAVERNTRLLQQLLAERHGDLE